MQLSTGVKSKTFPFSEVDEAEYIQVQVLYLSFA